MAFTDGVIGAGWGHPLLWGGRLRCWSVADPARAVGQPLGRLGPVLLVGLGADREADVAGVERAAPDVVRADEGLEGVALARRHQVIRAGHEDLHRAGDLLEIDELVVERELALGELVALVQLLDELAE